MYVLPLTQTSVTIISDPSLNPKLSLLYSRARLYLKKINKKLVSHSFQNDLIGYYLSKLSLERAKLSLDLDRFGGSRVSFRLKAL